MREGLFEILTAAGASVEAAGCGTCVNITGHLHRGDDQVVISSANRNFKGRLGNPKSEIWIGSAATVAASALTGSITDAREVEPAAMELRAMSRSLRKTRSISAKCFGNFSVVLRLFSALALVVVSGGRLMNIHQRQRPDARRRGQHRHPLFEQIPAGQGHGVHRDGGLRQGRAGFRARPSSRATSSSPARISASIRRASRRCT